MAKKKSPKLGNPAKVGAIRIHLVDESSGLSRTIGVMGASADGGVFITPSSGISDNVGWNYGVGALWSETGRPDLVHTKERPKVHYHRSGSVHISQSGVELERRQLWYPAVRDLQQAQMFSVVASGLERFPIHKGERKEGTVLLMCRTLPTAFALTISIVYPKFQRSSPQFLWKPGMGAVGLRASEHNQFMVDISAHNLPAYLVGNFDPTTDPEPLSRPAGLSIIATPGHISSATRTVESVIGMWSANLEKPMMKVELPSVIPSPRQLQRARKGEISDSSTPTGGTTGAFLSKLPPASS